MKLSYKGGGIALFQKDTKSDEYTILLGKRKHHPGKGKWSIPGGGYEDFDKNLTETTKREFKEETELNLSEIVTDLKPYEVNLIIFNVFIWRTLIFEMKPSYRLTKTVFHEFSEVKQIPLSELKKYKLAFGIKTEVKAFKKLYK